MLLAAYITVLVLGFIFNRSRIISFFQLLVIFVITGFNSGGIDFNTYEVMYVSSGQTNHFILGNEMVYYNLMRIFYRWGWDFVYFNALTTLIIVIILYYFLKKYASQPSLALSLFLIYPFFDMAIQKRNFLAMAVFLLAIDSILEYKKNWKIKYIFWTVFASLIHSSFLIYLPIFLMVNMETKRQLKIVKLVLTYEILLLPILPQLLSPFFSSQKIDLYFYNPESRIGIITIIGYIIIHLILYLIFKGILKIPNKETTLNKISLFFNELSIVVLPLYLYGSNFIRLYRNLFFVLFIAVTANYIVTNRGTILIKNFIPLSLQITFLIVISIFFYFIAGTIPYTDTILPLFNDNLILN